MNTTLAVFTTLYRSPGSSVSHHDVYKDAVGSYWPLPYCPRHRLHEQGIDPQAGAYCPWLDPIIGPKLLHTEHNLNSKHHMAKVKAKSALNKILGL